MSLHVDCIICATELDEPGAIILSPPDPLDHRIEKYHICASCWAEYITSDTPDELALQRQKKSGSDLYA